MFWKILSWPWRVVRWALYARPIHFTRFGTFYILFSLAVGGAAINTGNNLLYLMLGLLLGFIIISGFLSDSCLWGLDVEFQPIGDFYAGQPAEWNLIAHKSWFPAIIVYVEASWPERSTRHLFYWIPRHGSQQLRVTLTPKRRGYLPLTSVRTSTRFPFGLFEKSHQTSSNRTWVVFPQIQTLPAKILQAGGISLADQPAGRKGWGTTPFDLREFQTGDSSKRIHWKSSAKRGQLMVSEMEEESAEGQRVVVSRWPDAEKDPAGLESFISFVASLLYTLSLRGQRIGLHTPGADFRPDLSSAHLKRMLTYLALVDPARELLLPRTADVPAARSIDTFTLWKKAL